MTPAAREKHGPAADETAGKKERIVRAAEMIFAQQGYVGTTMRALADTAGVPLSLIVYHFQTKLGLYQEVFARRQYLNEDRLELLRQIDATTPDAMKEVVDAFADPILRMHDSPTGVWFARLVLREASDPSSQERGIIHELFDPMAAEFIAAIERANPGRDPDFYRWAYLFAVGVLTSSSYDARASDLGILGRTDEGVDAPKRRYLKAFILSGWSARA
jgi:AcrR family transcriptional regulator